MAVLHCHQADWMGQLPDTLQSVPLTTLAIPGSHQSLAIENDMHTDFDFSPNNSDMIRMIQSLPEYPVFKHFKAELKTIWKRWGSKQSCSLPEQLLLGVRYLDLRVAKYRKDGHLYGENGLYTGRLIKYMMEIEEFLQNHPKEVVILHFKQLSNMGLEDEVKLLDMVKDIFGQKLCPRSRLDLLSLRSLREYGYQIIIFFKPSDTRALQLHEDRRLVWTDDVIGPVAWPTVSQSRGLIRFLDQEFSLRKSTTRDCSQMYVLAGLLAPTMDMTYGQSKYQSMGELAGNEANVTFAKWLQDKQGLNVVISDFVGRADVISNTLKMNIIASQTT